MTAADKKKAQILVLLAAFAGLTWYWVYASGPEPTASTTQETKRPRTAAPAPDARIRLDLLHGSGEAEDVGRKNLFQYGQAPPPPRETAPAASAATNSSQIQAASPPPPPKPVPPAPPPFKAFRYEGYSIDLKSGRWIATLTEAGNTYHLTEGERLAEYLVLRITDTAVEIEDTKNKQRRTFSRAEP